MKNLRSILLVVAVTAEYVSCGGTCDVYDGDSGERIGKSRHVAGRIRKGAAQRSELPGRFRFADLRPVRTVNGSCASRDVQMIYQSNVLRFVLGEVSTDPSPPDSCSFDVELQPGDGCPEDTRKSFQVEYLVEEERDNVFDEDGYDIQMTFPVRYGTYLFEGSGTDVVARDFNGSIRLFEPFDGLTVVTRFRGSDNGTICDLRTTKLLYLTEGTNLTLIAVDDVGRVKGKAAVRLSPGENSTLPKPEFERNYYNVTLLRSELTSDADVFPMGWIRLREGYPRLSFSLSSHTESSTRFRVSYSGGIEGIRIGLVESNDGNFSDSCILLQLTARLIDDFGHEAEGSTILHVRITDSVSASHNSTIHECESQEHLTITIIILTVINIVLFSVIIYGYFRYAKKKESKFVCDVCANKAMKRRRPTPRRISDYTYPLDLMPPPLETLQETEAEEEPEAREPKPQTPGDKAGPRTSATPAKTRKRSVTFRESDDEARHIRENEGKIE